MSGLFRGAAQSGRWCVRTDAVFDQNCSNNTEWNPSGR